MRARGIRYVMRGGVVVVETVIPGTPADAIGLTAGDVIVSLDDKPIETTDELQHRIRTSRPGRVAKLVVDREGSTLRLTPRLAAWPKKPTARDAPAPRSRP
jgi:serine protease DegQ